MLVSPDKSSVSKLVTSIMSMHSTTFFIVISLNFFKQIFTFKLRLESMRSCYQKKALSIPKTGAQRRFSHNHILCFTAIEGLFTINPPIEDRLISFSPNRLFSCCVSIFRSSSFAVGRHIECDTKIETSFIVLFLTGYSRG